MTARLFHLERDVDATGVSGTGVVADGVEFSDGFVVLHWRTYPFATGVYPSFNAVDYVHCHGDQTRVVWL